MGIKFFYFFYYSMGRRGMVVVRGNFFMIECQYTLTRQSSD